VPNRPKFINPIRASPQHTPRPAHSFADAGSYIGQPRSSEQFGLSVSGLSDDAHTTAFATLHSRPVALPMSSVCFSQFTVARLNIGCLLSSASSTILNVPTAYIPKSLSCNPLLSYELNASTFEHELAQAVPAYPKTPSRLPMIASRINIAEDLPRYLLSALLVTCTGMLLRVQKLALPQWAHPSGWDTWLKRF
jgi:hypothetical protein